MWIGRAPLLEEVSRAALVLETWRFTVGGTLVANVGLGELVFHLWRKSRTKHRRSPSQPPTLPHIGVARSHLRIHIVTPSHPPSPSFFIHIFSLNSFTLRLEVMALGRQFELSACSELLENLLSRMFEGFFHGVLWST